MSRTQTQQSLRVCTHMGFLHTHAVPSGAVHSSLQQIATGTLHANTASVDKVQDAMVAALPQLPSLSSFSHLGSLGFAVEPLVRVFEH